MKNQKHIYIIGIGGVGTVWIADWALNNGYKVSGSDINESAVTKRLQEDGANIHYTIDPKLIPDDVTEAVINSAITPSSPSYPELVELQSRKLPNSRALPILKRAQWIGKLTRSHFTIGVAGTHGKTTTTAMVGWILEKAGYDPTVLVGGTVKAWGNKTKIGKSNIIVIEADEFDRSFHQFKVDMALILNIETDHLDYYTKGLPEIEQSFKRFLRNLPNRKEQIVQPVIVIPGLTRNPDTGTKSGMTKGILIAYNQPSIRKISKSFSFKAHYYDEKNLFSGLKLIIPGKHNLLNATGAGKIAHELGIDSKTIQSALSTFPGVGRRFEYLGKWQNADVYDDYAHHPTELKATLQAIAELVKNKTTKEKKPYVTVVFQPHQKARTQSLLKEFGRAFDENPPDNLIIAPIYQVAGRETDIPVSSQDIVTEIAKNAPADFRYNFVVDNDTLESVVSEAVKTTDILVVVGAGSIRSMTDIWMQN